MIKTTKRVALILIVIVLISFLFVVLTLFYKHSEFAIKCFFYNNKNKFEDVVEHFSKKCESLYINFDYDEGITISCDKNYVLLNDCDVKDEITDIFDYLKISVVIFEEDNIMFFQLASTLDSGKGVLFSLKNNVTAKNMNIYVLKELGDGWYYYEEKYRVECKWIITVVT